MTVKELIDVLSELPPDTPVIVRSNDEFCRTFKDADFKAIRVFGTRGGYGRFASKKLQHRNNVEAVLIS